MQRTAPTRTALGPPPAPPAQASRGGLHVLRVRLWDMHAARRYAARLRSAGVGPGSVTVTGNRRADGLVEAEVRPPEELTERWRLNGIMATVAALVVGAPMGVAVLTFVLGEHVLVTVVGATVGGLGLGAVLLHGVWADHFQRYPDTRPVTRVEGVVTVRGDVAVVRAEMLLTTAPGVMGVERLPWEGSHSAPAPQHPQGGGGCRG